MKEVIYGQELKDTILLAADLICNAVGSTLGPSGNNVIINKDDLAPFITNDGVTIAESINDSNPKINTILEIIKESSLKTNEVVGDGTTTTLVLLNGVLKEGFKEIEKGKSGIKIKKELDDSANIIIKELLKMKRKPSKEDLINVAGISCGDIMLGKFITEVFLKMKSSNSIKIKQSLNDKTYYEIKKGYSLDIENIPLIYFKEHKEINLNDAYIIILNGYLNNLEEISDVINEGLEHNKSIVILASDFDESIMQNVIVYNIQANKNIYLFKLPDYGIRKMKIIEDLCALCNAKPVDLNFENNMILNLKKVSNITINPNNITIVNNSKDIKNYLNKLKKELNNTYETYEKDFLKERISKLDKGIATIYIGASTNTESKDKVMRALDAISALNIASEGVVIGEGISFLKISNNISNSIMKKSLQRPFEKILENAGEDIINRKNDIIKYNYQKILNIETKNYEDINDTKIIDPVLVLIEEIKNSISIAGMLLTTNYLVINETLKDEMNNNMI